ncbi:hypothetical protein [Candidatus Uabimicrobium amorphum]|uniref:Peptidase S74 domain-containing protein n=1 Tax=Uabimicrobium amorphum TaxID=2596890 RepID=A0A5S9IQN2_UABAM|nr:hypothetical protein [Candidatus Uabimicrobium amorphum]BBM86323.1 hypothetical protein UABAM_04709 [Candidatus Uabimicrobium amorphum]
MRKIVVLLFCLYSFIFAAELTLGGSAKKYYPVFFYDDAWARGAFDVHIYRQVHDGTTWHGTLIAKFRSHGDRLNGSSTSFAEADIHYYIPNKTTNANLASNFIAGYTYAKHHKGLIVWLRGGTKYSFSFAAGRGKSRAIYNSGSNMEKPLIIKTSPKEQYYPLDKVKEYVNKGRTIDQINSKVINIGNTAAIRINGDNQGGDFLDISAPNFRLNNTGIWTKGNVGIGTTNPSAGLHLQGTALIRASSTSLLEIESLSGETDIKFRDPKNNQSWQVGSNKNGFYIYDDKAAKYRFNLNKNGNIGINTKNPEGTLHLGGSVPRLVFGEESKYAIDINGGRFRLKSLDKHTFIEMSGASTTPKVQINSELLILKNVSINGRLQTTAGVHTGGKDIYFDYNHTNNGHGIGLYRAAYNHGNENYPAKLFAGENIDGPVAYGWSGGALGSKDGGEKIALRWDQNQNVSIKGNLTVEKTLHANHVSAKSLNITENFDAKSLHIDKEGWVGLNMAPEKGYTLSINGNAQIKGKIITRSHVHTQGNDVYFHNDSNDLAHGIGMYHDTRKFANTNVNGPVVYGWSGGALGSTDGGQKIALRWDKDGNVGIGVMNTQGSKLAVKGKITAEEIRVINMKKWADFVFADDYKLLPINELEQSIKRNKHLPNIPSEREVKEQGIQLGEMQAKLLQKIEELTLYTIQQEKKITTLQQQKNTLESKVAKMQQNEQKIDVLQQKLDSLLRMINQK